MNIEEILALKGIYPTDFISSSIYQAVVEAMKDMYNKGIEDAVDHAKILEEKDLLHSDCIVNCQLNTEEILKLKI